MAACLNRMYKKNILLAFLVIIIIGSAYALSVNIPLPTSSGNITYNNITIINSTINNTNFCYVNNSNVFTENNTFKSIKQSLTDRADLGSVVNFQGSNGTLNARRNYTFEVKRDENNFATSALYIDAGSSGRLYFKGFYGVNFNYVSYLEGMPPSIIYRTANDNNFMMNNTLDSTGAFITRLSDNNNNGSNLILAPSSGQVSAYRDGYITGIQAEGWSTSVQWNRALRFKSYWQPTDRRNFSSAYLFDTHELLPYGTHTNWKEANRTLMSLSGNGTLNITEHLIFAGNLSGNQIYGELAFHNDSFSNTTIIASANTYYNITALGSSQKKQMNTMNGFTNQSNSLKAVYSGLYQASLSISFTGAVNDIYNIPITINGVEQENCEPHSKTGTAGDIISASANCFIRLNANDLVYVQVLDETAGGNIDVKAMDLNLVRIGN